MPSDEGRKAARASRSPMGLRVREEVLAGVRTELGGWELPEAGGRPRPARVNPALIFPALILSDGGTAQSTAKSVASGPG